MSERDYNLTFVDMTWPGHAATVADEASASSARQLGVNPRQHLPAREGLISPVVAR